MASSNGVHSEQIQPEFTQPGPAATIISELADSSTKRPTADNDNNTALGSSNSESNNSAEARAEKVKDQIDDAVAKGPKKADEHSGGRVQVAETGDLKSLAARRQSTSAVP